MAWKLGQFTLDPERFELARDGTAMRVEPQVLTLLIHLIRNRDRMVGKEEIARVVWNGKHVSDASISSRIRSAREAIGDTGKNQSFIRTVHGRGFRFAAEVAEVPAARPARAEQTAGPDSAELSRPSVAVLPFRPLGATPDLKFLAEAIPHEIIQALSRMRWLAVIARGSSFRFSKAGTDLDLVGAALGAGYTLSGMVEIQRRAVVVVIELADVGRGEVIWGDRLTAPMDEIERLRQRIASHVATALDLHVPQNEARLAGLGGSDRLDAWSNFHLGLNQLYRFKPDANHKARGYFDRAVKLDPRFARAHAGLSFTRFLDAFLHLGPDDREATAAARRHAERGLELDPLDPFVHFTMGRSFWLTGDPETAAGWLKRAVELNPNYAQGYYASAFTAMLTGNIAAADSEIDAALNLSPLDPLLYAMHGVRAFSLIQTGDLRAAARWADRAATTPGAHYLIAMIAAMANGLAGRHQQAARWRQEARRRKPDACAAQFFAAFPLVDGDPRARIAAELRRQGF
ncbi:MAG: winged helix-turn-helix domain-containing protein [Pararhodobacter sp.]|nr:winged helix-turn-helix domain-containing protein [Pararhodobacter sp.]